MKKKTALLIAFCIMIISTAMTVSAADTAVYVSTRGSKTAAGTINAPVDTIGTALDLVKASGNTSAVIYVMGGNYFLDEPIVIDNTLPGSLTIEAYNGEDVLLSGGRRISGWKYNATTGLWETKAPGYDYIRNMTVNGVSAKRAYNETKILNGGFANDYGTDAYVKQGIVVNTSDLPTGFKGNEAEIRIEYKWQDFIIQLDHASVHPDDATKTILWLKPSVNNETSWMWYTWQNYFTNNPFTVSNDLTLLNNENEFYYDTYTETLYYKAAAGVDMTNAEVYAGEKEELLKIQGTSADRVENVTIKGLTFANAKWDNLEYIGYINAQSTRTMDVAQNSDSTEVNEGMVPAAIQVTWADSISFIGNKFINLDKVGLGLYEGVNNSLIEGNVFSDIGHSAISVGLASHMYDTKSGLTDVAYNKPAFSPTSYLQYTPNNGNNGDITSFWSSNTVSVENCWWAVDLGQGYTINSVEIQFYTNAAARQNFVVEAANDPEFSAVWQVSAQGATDPGEIWAAACQSTDKFRYVRYRQTAGTVGEIRNFRVYTADLNGIPEKEICKNNEISNNYIVRAGVDMYSAPGMHLYCVKNTAIHHNYMRELPYSGISLGYGWSATHGMTGGNSITNNRIEYAMQRLYDGGAIYVLGDEPGLRVTGNYIKDSRFGAGGWYPDEARGTAANPINVSDNVFEDVPFWNFTWNPNSTYTTISNNWTTGPSYGNAAGTGIVLSNNKCYVRPNPPAEVTDIINAAGIQSPYTGIVNKAVALEDDGYLTQKDITNDFSMIFSDDYSGTKYQLMLNLIETAQYLKYLIDDGYGDETSAYGAFLSALNDAEYVYNYGNANKIQIADAKVNLHNATKNLYDSGAFDNYNPYDLVTSVSDAVSH